MEENTKSRLFAHTVGLLCSGELWSGLLMVLLVCVSTVQARDLNYTGSEQAIYVKPGEPTQVMFPGKIEGGYKPNRSQLALDRRDNYLIIVGQPQLGPDGEGIIVHLDDRRNYALRVMPAGAEQPKDVTVNVIDTRPPEVEETETSKSAERTGFAPPTAVSGLMREMVLAAEFGKSRGIPGYRRSDRYSGQMVLNDGTLEAKVEEIYMGSELWGYVLRVENKLQTSMRINPATFRLDGTKAVSAQRWELAPQPLTDEQRIAASHNGRVYIVTRAKRQ